MRIILDGHGVYWDCKVRDLVSYGFDTHRMTPLIETDAPFAPEEMLALGAAVEGCAVRGLLTPDQVVLIAGSDLRLVASFPSQHALGGES
jgi:hypothetical protein